MAMTGGTSGPESGESEPKRPLFRQVSKAEFYDQMCKNLARILHGERNWVTNLSNSSGFVYNAFQEYNDGEGRGINWLGFYLLPHLIPGPPEKIPATHPLSPYIPGKLFLGPFQGRPACRYISLPVIAETSTSSLTSPGRQASSSSSSSSSKKTLKKQESEEKQPMRISSVYGKSFIDRVPMIIDDVSKYKGQVNCDKDTRSELVLPITLPKEGVKCCLGVFDLDCIYVNGFDDDDRIGLEKVLEVIVGHTSWW